MPCLDFSDTAIISPKNVDYCHTFYDVSKSEAICFLENYMRDHRGFILKNAYQD